MRMTQRGRLWLIVLALPLMAHKCPTAPKAEDACVAGFNGEPPVIIVAGTLSPQIANELFLGNALQYEGYTHCVFELNGSDQLQYLPGTAPIGQSARALKIFVDRVLEWSGHTTVDLIGHSQGVLAARDYIKFRGGQSKVDTLISLAGPNSGTDAAGAAQLFVDPVLAPFGVTCAEIFPCEQMQQGSSYIEALNDGDDTPGAIEYYSFYTNNDAFVWHFAQGPLGIPYVSYTNARLEDGATNVEIDEECPLRWVSHLGMILDPVVYEMISDALAGDLIDVPASTCLLPPVLLPI